MPHSDLIQPVDLVSRRALFVKSLTGMAGLALGFRGLNALGLPAGGGISDLSMPTSCTLTCASTVGPCYYDSQLIRQDITEGVTGLPMLISFLVVNADTCQPVSNASIDIWHADAAGVYSGPINTMCSGSDLAVRQQIFLRGIQFTDAAGWAHFNSVYPGWYSSRTTHIHLTVRVNGAEMVTTQLFFDDDFTTFVYHNFSPYTSRPNKDTTNLGDNVIGGSASRAMPFLFDTKLIENKTLVVRKLLAIRGTKTTCAA